MSNVIDSIKTLINYLWKDELKNFCETYGMEVQSQDNLEDWIKVCEISPGLEEPMTNHIFYHLMVIKHHFSETSK
jgi:hypothetical protein